MTWVVYVVSEHVAKQQGEIFDQIVAWTGARWDEVMAFKPNPWEGNR